MNSPLPSPIIGIDLGTTNSVVAAYIDGKVTVIEENGEGILPSVVAMTIDGKLIVGQTAKNQLAAFPDRTIASVKRRMGEAVELSLADQKFTPQEISAMILRRLRQRAEMALKTEVTRAVITVPAFFDENQRQATREAGQLAGLTVERIINEPTAASLVYHANDDQRRHLIVYDLGGGTFDVSIVRVEQGVIEVLSSKGDTQLGGDDFDELLTKHVSDIFLNRHHLDLMAQSTTRWRLQQACERAKCELSSASCTRIAEEFIATVDGQPVNLDVEVSRLEYEELITPLVERTISCVDDAIRESGLSSSQLDELILVGGSTRTPLVQRRLQQEFHRDPQWAVNPDLAVALGAATQAAMQEGHSVGPVLIDVATHTLGLAALSGSSMLPELEFFPIIRRNAPLPAKYEEPFYKSSPYQKEAQIEIYQGESPHLKQNRRIGQFLLDGLQGNDSASNEITVRFELTLDGILSVTAVERQTGLSKTLKIDNALAQMGKDAGYTSQDRMDSLFEEHVIFNHLPIDNQEEIDASGDSDDCESPSEGHSAGFQKVDESQPLNPPHSEVVAKARSMRASLSGDDANDVDRLVEQIETAERNNDYEMLAGLQAELDDLLFYLA